MQQVKLCLYYFIMIVFNDMAQSYRLLAKPIHLAVAQKYIPTAAEVSWENYDHRNIMEVYIRVKTT